jgi:Uma2 family endonuclease
MALKTREMTLEEFLALPEEKPALELIDGEVIQKPMPKIKHALAILMLSRRLIQHPATSAGWPFSELGQSFPDTLRANHRIPDLMYFRSALDLSKPYPTEPADLAVEVRSPGQTVASLQQRLAFLRERGVRCTLLIDPEAEMVYVHDAGREWVAGRDDTVVMDGLDGFSFAVADLFRP